MTSACVRPATRTPFGRLGGALSEVRPDDLAATALSGLLAKTPSSSRTGSVRWSGD